MDFLLKKRAQLSGKSFFFYIFPVNKNINEQEGQEGVREGFYTAAVLSLAQQVYEHSIIKVNNIGGGEKAEMFFSRRKHKIKHTSCHQNDDAMP